MKQVICITLFIVLFLTLHTLASWVFPFLFVLWFIVWIVIGLISLVLCKLVYDWLENQENGHLPPKRRAMVFFSILFVSISIFGFRYWNEFREKPLERVLDNYSYPEEVVINPNENTRKIIKDTQEIRELIDFLSQYEVQKSKNDYKYRVADPYEFWWKNDKGFSCTFIFSKSTISSRFIILSNESLSCKSIMLIEFLSVSLYAANI